MEYIIKPKVVLLMNTFIKNMLLFSDEIKRSMSDEKARGKSRDVEKTCPLRGSNPGGAMGKKAMGINGAVANRQ